jgi:hypothetical protein
MHSDKPELTRESVCSNAGKLDPNAGASLAAAVRSDHSGTTGDGTQETTTR